FDAIALAFEVLSDPSLRAEFDKLKGVGQDDGKPQFSGIGFFDALNVAIDLRAAILCILYDRRRAMPVKPSLSPRHLNGMLQVTKEEMDFALWYLNQRLLVTNDEKSSLQITVEGMDHLELNPPAPERVMRFLKPDSVQNKPHVAPKRTAAEASSGRQSVLAAL